MQSSSGTEEPYERLWSRYLTAPLNMIDIIRNFCLNGEIPERSFSVIGLEEEGDLRRM